MTGIFAVTLPVYMTIALGYATVRIGYIDSATVHALGRFTLKVGLPALIFNSIVSSQGDEALNWSLMAGYLVASLAMLLIGYGTIRLAFEEPRGAAWIHGLATAQSNSGFIGYSIAALVFPDQALRVLAWIMIVENVAIIPCALVAAEVASGEATGFRNALRGAMVTFVRNPLVLAVAVALLVRSSGQGLPDFLLTTVSALASVAPVIALFVVGGIIARFSVSLVWRRTAVIVIGKLLLHPLLVFAALSVLLGPSEPLVLAAVLFAAVPMLSIYPVLAEIYHAEQVAATALIVTTMLSFFSISLLIGVIGGF